MCCLLSLVCEYVIYIMHMLLKIHYYFLYCHIVVGFRFRLTNLVSGIHQVWFWVWIITRTGVQGGFRFWVRVLGSDPRRLHLIQIYPISIPKWVTNRRKWGEGSYSSALRCLICLAPEGSPTMMSCYGGSSVVSRD